MHYTSNKGMTMMLRWILVFAVLCGSVSFVMAADAKAPQFSRGVITSLKHTMRARTVAYQVNTPLTQEEDVYELTVQVGTAVYSGEYIPREEGVAFPADTWNEGDAVQVRLSKHDLILKRPAGVDLKLYIQKRGTAAALAGKEKPDPKSEAKSAAEGKP